ncbi:MAG: hypothetical protein GF320_08270 [Armatimonadia bacterium]|jgi:hypothetical protein|nr:hypothetical protein [Armatimonadia bacterium]
MRGVLLTLAGILAIGSIAIGLMGCSGKADPDDAPPIATSGVDEGKLPEPGDSAGEDE